MRYKQASVDMVGNYVRYRPDFGSVLLGRPAGAELEHVLHEMKWKGYQVLVTIEAPARRRKNESEEEQLQRSFRRQPWGPLGDNLQSERAKRAKEHRR